jgi:hypothetical protein
MMRNPFIIQLDAPYDELFRDVLAFASFAETEETILRLEKLLQRFESDSDKKGVDYCRQIARLGRRRAEMIAGNKRVDANKRLQKKEIALWFRIWLETRSLFPAWLDLRKKTREFRRLQSFKLD